MRLNLNNINLGNIGRITSDIDSIKRVVQSQVDENAPKKLITRELIQKRNKGMPIIFGIFWLFISILSLIIFIAADDTEKPIWVYPFLSLFIIIGIVMIILPIINKHKIQNDEFTVEEDIVINSYITNRRDSDGDVYTHYVIELVKNGIAYVSRATYIDCMVDDIVYVVLSSKGKKLGVFPQKLYEVSPELTITHTIEKNNQDVGVETFETETIDNTFEKRFKLNNTFEK